MRADDEVLHIQLQHIVESARRATTADRVIMIIEFHDDEKDKQCTMMVFDDKHDQPTHHAVAGVTVATLAAVDTMLSQLSPLRIELVNTKTGERKPFDQLEPHMVVLEGT